MGKTRVGSVFKFHNGMCGVCDEKGEQIPHLQGRWEKSFPLLANGSCDFTVCEFEGLSPSEIITLRNSSHKEESHVST